MRADVQEPDLRHTAPGERANYREPVSIKGIGCKSGKGIGCKSGGCVRKAVELTSGDLRRVSVTRLREPQGSLTPVQKSAEGIVGRDVGEAI